MNFDGIKSYLYPEINETLKANFEAVCVEDTVDSIDHFKVNLNVIIRLRGGSVMQFPMVVRTTGLSAKKATLKYNVDLTKIYVTCFLMWLFLSFMFYLLSPTWIAGLFGIPGALLVWFSMRSSVSKALSIFEKRLSELHTKRIKSARDSI